VVSYLFLFPGQVLSFSWLATYPLLGKLPILFLVNCLLSSVSATCLILVSHLLSSSSVAAPSLVSFLNLLTVSSLPFHSQLPAISSGQVTSFFLVNY
jgi:hypothetical protein